MDRLANMVCVAVIAGAGVLGAGCTGDKGSESQHPFEEARYPAVQEMLDSSFVQFCASINDALEAQYTTDTAFIPGLMWPYEVPAHPRTEAQNTTDPNTSWGVRSNFHIDTTEYFVRWDLGRLVDTGVILFDSPIVATKVLHRVDHVRIDGGGNDAIEWTFGSNGTINVTLDSLDTEAAKLAASIVAKRKVGGECSDSPGGTCDSVGLHITDAHLDKISGAFALSTLSGALGGTIRIRQFNVVLGYDAVFIWRVSGLIANGVATVTISSGGFAETDDYPVCP